MLGRGFSDSSAVKAQTLTIKKADSLASETISISGNLLSIGKSIP